jgi:hypothetical protein
MENIADGGAALTAYANCNMWTWPPKNVTKSPKAT